MGSRAKHAFPQEAPATPYKTVLLPDLECALVIKRLHNRIPRDPTRMKARSGWLGDGRFVWVRRPRHRLVREAGRWASLQIRSDLQTGVLIAYMPTERPGIFLRIKPQFWHEPHSGIRVDGMLFDLDKGVLVPDEIDESTFCVFEECARSWLTRWEIDESNPAFPDALRTGEPVRTGSKPSEEQITAELLRLHGAGIRRDQIARDIRKKPGFESVGNVRARDLMAGLLPRGRPRKRKKAN